MTAPAPDTAQAELPLPTFAARQFELTEPPECDLVMKGGITSGVVYPYAVLQIATKYRLRSIGGTSAGAIAAAFAAAAEYARREGRPEGFLTLKQYCDELPELLLSLFQPHPQFAAAISTAKAAIAAGGPGAIVARAVRKGILPMLLGAILLGGLSYLLQSSIYAVILASLLGGLVGAGLGIWRWGRRIFVAPLLDALGKLPGHHFGFCTGLTQTTDGKPAVTDWIYRALQHIAFGDPDHPVPLTFGHLEGPDGGDAAIHLRMVTTNLSMRRPHTLPRLGVAAGFMPEDWNTLFPTPVMTWLMKHGTKKWQRFKGSWLFPAEDKLPVIIAVRMSLSFPVLFTAVPLRIEDTELPAIVAALGGKPYKRIREAHFSDGGISSNFPIHMFDAPLPTRPTFAFSLDDLLWDPDEVKTRVTLPKNASEGMGVQVKEIRSLQDFGWQVLSSAKDWQDQLLSEITGQRERIARVFLTSREGGLNLDMPPDVSRRLMRWGYEAGCKFTDGSFDFDEHRWRRLLVIYKHLQDNLDAMDRIWDEGFADWYKGYQRQVQSYKGVGIRDRKHIAADIAALLAARDAGQATRIVNRDDKLPKRAGVLKVGPRY